MHFLSMAFRLVFIVILFICSDATAQKFPQSSKNKAAQGDQAAAQGVTGWAQPVLTAEQIVENFDSFWSYFNTYAQFKENYPTFDERGKAIDKGEFLSKIDSGDYLHLVLQNPSGKRAFKLVRMPEGTSRDIRLLLMNYANKELIYYRMEGKPIPAFRFQTIDGKIYTSANTRGKIVLFKCWFIDCAPCRAEMPALNRLVQKYRNRKDILFISLALDQKPALKKFLKTTRFNYETVAGQKEYMTSRLHVQLYPAHYLINKSGILVKVPSDRQELESYLEQLLKQGEKKQR